MANADEVKTEVKANANDDKPTETSKEDVKVKKESETSKDVKEEKELDASKNVKEEKEPETPKEDVKVKKEPIILTKDLEAKIIRQIEYYFGDINLPRDKFLQEQITLEDGWVPLSVLLTFNRLCSICPDANTIAQAIMNSENDLVIVNEDRTKVRRNPEMPVPEYNEERRKELSERTAYAKGFPPEESLENLMKFFEQYGPHESVIMLSYKDKLSKKRVFKGSVFVIFKTLDLCKAFMEKDEVKYKDTVLIRKWQADYYEGKKKEREERNEKRGKNKKDESKEPQKHTFAKGAIAHMTGFKDTTARETIKKEVTKIFGKEPAYVTFDKGDTEGYLRFSEENNATDFIAKLTESKFTVDEAEITVRALEGEEEEKFLQELSQTMTKIRSQHKSYGRSKNRKRKGGGGDGGSRAKYQRK